MFTKQDLKEYGVAYFVFATVLTNARNDNQLTIPQLIVFRDQVYRVEAELGIETRVVLRDFKRGEVVAAITSAEELLEVLING